MKKLSFSLLAAVTFAVGAVSIAAPTQAVAATNGTTAATISPDYIPGYYYQNVYFDEYPPDTYEDGNGYVGYLTAVNPAPGGGYYGVYYGTSPGYF